MSIEATRLLDPTEKRRIAERILLSLPNWFGIPSSTAEYIESVMNLPFFAVYRETEAIGFLALQKTSVFAYEIHVMGVLSEYHRNGVGRALVLASADYARENGARYMTVKTLDESNPDPYYAMTRAFYLGMGFLPLEVFLTLWDPSNPCLLMIRDLLEPPDLKG